MKQPPLPPAVVPLALALALLGCAEPELGLAPFKCNRGQPECPKGYACLSDVCVKEGSSPPVLDGGQRQDGAQRDRGKEGGVKKDTVPWVVPKVYVTEFMADPKATADDYGEWIELYNGDSKPVDINGWTIKDKGSDSHVISSSGALLIPIHGFLVIGQSKDKSSNGGVEVAYAYSGFQLDNEKDDVILQDAAGATVDSFSYSKPMGFLIPTGSSLSALNPNLNRNVASNWCPETSAWTGSAGDKGTPGSPPRCK